MVRHAAALLCAVALAAAAIDNNEVTPRLGSSEDLLWEVAEDCLGAPGGMKCLRRKVLGFFGEEVSRARALDSDETMDEAIAEGVRKFAETHEFRLRLPEMFFQGATLTFRPARGLHNFQVVFPEQEGARDAASAEARDMMKKKMLLPLLLLLKLKLKALTPIMLGLVSLKATKALILSKIAILLVVGFLVMQLCKKMGMPMPMAMPMMPEMPPSSAYGAPAPAPPMDSYGPAAWDSGNGNGNGNGGPYSRVWTPTDAHHMAYNAYYAQQAQAQKTPST